MDCVQEVKINFSFQLQTSQVFKKELHILALPNSMLNHRNDRNQFKNEFYSYLLNNSVYSVKEVLEFSRDN
jgi:hypothetical protein